jgi:hypothetical protein
MDIRSSLLAEHSKTNADRIVNHILTNQTKINDLMVCFFDDSVRLCQWAAWPVGILEKKEPDLIFPFMDEMIENLENPKHNAVVGNTLRAWQFMKIPESQQGKIFDICFKFLLDPTAPVTMRAFGMTVCANVCDDIPELSEELALVISENMEYGTSGFKSRGRKILKKFK